MTAFYWTVRNDMRVPLRRQSADSAWPIRFADGSRPCDRHPEYQAKRAS